MNGNAAASATNTLPQIVAAMSASLGAFSMGTALAWTSPTLPYIIRGQCDSGVVDEAGPQCDMSDVSQDDGSWMGCLLPVGACVAGPVTGYLLTRIGRRLTMILLSIPLCLGFGCLASAFYLDSKILIFAGRFLTGFSAGSFPLAAPLYIAETSDPSIRGALCSMISTMATVGMVCVNGLSIKDTLHWNIISELCMPGRGLAVLMAISMYFMPESPNHLLFLGKEKDALKALMFLKGNDHEAYKEIEHLKSQQEILKKNGEAGGISLKDFFTVNCYVKPLLLVVMLMALQQFSGVNVVLFYGQTIFKDAGSTMDPAFSAFLLNVTQLLVNSLAVLLVDKYGRKILLLISSFFMTLALSALAFYFYMKEHSSKVVCSSIPGETEEQGQIDCYSQENLFDPSLVMSLSWFPLASLIFYIIAFSIGASPLPWTVNAEIFPPEASTMGSSIGFIVNWFCAFVITKFYPNLESLLNTSGTYLSFAAVCATSTLLIYRFLPETKGILPEEMKQLFAKNDESNLVKHREEIDVFVQPGGKDASTNV